MYAFDTAVSAGQVIMIPRKQDFSLDMDAVLEAIKQHKPKVVFLTSPNNPDGSMLPEEDLLKLLAQPVRSRCFISYPCARTATSMSCTCLHHGYSRVSTLVTRPHHRTIQRFIDNATVKQSYCISMLDSLPFLADFRYDP
jgi:hypothetical protein